MDRTAQQVQTLKPTVMWKLTTIAMVRVSQMLHSLYWSKCQWFMDADSSDQNIVNPLNIPSIIAKFLLRLLLIRFRPDIPQEEILRPLLMSGIEEVEFEFHGTSTNINNLIKIFHRLSQYGKNVTSIKIVSFQSFRDVFGCIKDSILNSEFLKMQLWAYSEENKKLYEEFTNLVLSTPNLRTLKTNIPFDNNSLASTPELVELNIPPMVCSNYFNKISDTKYTWLFEKLLDSLPNLRNLNNGNFDWFFHFFKERETCRVESKNNCSKSRCYKLSSLNIDINISDRNLTLISEMFPELKMLSFWLDKYNCNILQRSSKFFEKYLLSIENEYSLDLNHILHSFSSQITELNIDFGECSKFELMTTCSPLTNLQKLKIKYICLKAEESYNDQDMVDRFQKVFHNLKVFHINCCSCMNKFKLYKDFFMSTFVNCLKIEDFMLSFKDMSDQLIFDIFPNNFLSKLKFLHLFCHHIPSRALKHIILNSQELEYISLYSVDFEEDLVITSTPQLNIRHFVHCINPFVYV